MRNRKSLKNNLRIVQGRKVRRRKNEKRERRKI
jgi:hypothetical protein